MADKRRRLPTPGVRSRKGEAVRGFTLLVVHVVRDLVEHVADRDMARQLRRGLTELSAAASTTNGAAASTAGSRHE